MANYAARLPVSLLICMKRAMNTPVQNQRAFVPLHRVTTQHLNLMVTCFKIEFKNPVWPPCVVSGEGVDRCHLTQKSPLESTRVERDVHVHKHVVLGPQWKEGIALFNSCLCIQSSDQSGSHLDPKSRSKFEPHLVLLCLSAVGRVVVGLRLNGFLGLSLTDRTILFLVIWLDETVSVG